MHIITRRRLLEFGERHADAAEPLDVWFRTAKAAKWSSLVDVRGALPAADLVGDLTVFNIKGNAYRLVTFVNYRSQAIYIRDILTHAEYSKGGWKR